VNVQRVFSSAKQVDLVINCNQEKIITYEVAIDKKHHTLNKDRLYREDDWIV